MDGGSSPGAPIGEATNADLESPMSAIASDLSRSSLDSGSAKKRHLPRTRGTFGTSHRVNDHRSESLSFTKNETPQDLEAKYIPDLVSSLNAHGGWRGTHGHHDCNKENGGAAVYSHTPQRARSNKKIRQPLEIYEENSQDSGHPSSPLSEKERRQRRLLELMSGAAGARNHESVECPLWQAPYTTRPSTYGPKFTSSSLLRSLSSGYESMDDGLVSELNDMETTDEEEMQLPSGIAKLISGDLVGSEAPTDYDVSTTPDFSRNISSREKKWSVRSGMYKRSVRTLSSPLARSPLSVRSPSLERTPRLAVSPLERVPLSKIRTCLFRSPTATCSKRSMMRTYSYDEAVAHYRLQMEISPHSVRSYKRPSEDLLENETSIMKRSRKSNGLLSDTTPVSVRRSSTLTHSQIALQRSMSETMSSPNETHTNIKWAIHRSITDNDLIGDFSKPCILPLTNGLHGDLKTITSNTVAALLRGEFVDRVASYKIIDCRYPYEFEAGHIKGAVNIYNMDLVQQVMLNHLTAITPRIQLDTDKRNILVFHCEFSWERGPNLSRVLRRLDRACNKEHYPALYYPEIYLLLGGYEKFYSEQKEFCMPQDYKPMKDPNHEEECRFFRSKCKSWQAEKTKGISQTVRTNLERLAF